MIIFLQYSLTVLAYYVVLINLSKYSLNKMEILPVICFSIILCGIIYTINPKFEIVTNFITICLATFFLARKTRKVLLSVAFSIISMLIMMLSSAVVSFIIYSLFGNGSIFVRENMFTYLFACLTYAISFFISKLLGNSIKQLLNTMIGYLKNKYIAFILFGILITLLFFYYFFFVAPYVTDDTIDSAISSAITVGYLVFLLIAVYASMNGEKKSIESAHKQKMMGLLRDYFSKIEFMNKDMRKFRHDYVNIISAMLGYLKDENYKGLEKYFMEKVVPMDKRLKSIDATYDLLSNIHIPELKGIVSFTLSQAQERGIPIHIEVPDIIDYIDFDSLQLAQIVGILIDNAREACLASDNPYIQFAAFKNKKSNSVTMILINPTDSQPSVIQDMFKDGYSTKGDNRGLGLHTVRELLDKNKDATIFTFIENHEFRHELTFGCRREGD